MDNLNQNNLNQNQIQNQNQNPQPQPLPNQPQPIILNNPQPQPMQSAPIQMAQQPANPFTEFAPQPQTIPQSTAVKKEGRKFSILESAFAWICLILGYLFCRAFPPFENALGSFIVTLVIFGVTATILAFRGAKFNLSSIISAVSGVAISAGLIINSNNTLQNLIGCYCILAYVYFVYSATGNKIEKGFSNFVIADFFKAIFVMPFASFGYLFRATSRRKDGTRNKGFVPKILLGIAIGFIPLVIVLTLLSYDENFVRIMRNIFDFNLDTIFSHIVSIGFGIPIGMYIYGLFISSVDNKFKEGSLDAESLGKASKSVKIAPLLTVIFAIVPILLVYLVFFISQWKYYISGFLGKLPQNMIYSEYARKGFFELCGVAVINVILLILVAVFAKRKDDYKERPAIRLLSGLISLSSLILITTALAKMWMYIEAYGLTPKRVYSTWFMVSLFAIFLVALIKQIFVKMKLLPLAVVLSILFFGSFAVVGADSFIAEYNVNRYLNGTLKEIDVEAMQDLGDAAIPSLVKVIEQSDKTKGTNFAEYKKDFDNDINSNEYSDATTENVANYLCQYSSWQKDAYNNGFFSYTIPKIKAQTALNRIIAD
jgi:hypothetical protein